MRKNPKQKVKIVVGYHKEHDKYLQNEVLLPLFMGRSPEYGPRIDSDNTGDNISYKNFLYCELTGIYWLWKNVDADVKGLFHYRRVLTDRRPVFNNLRMSIKYRYSILKCFLHNKTFLLQDKRRVKDVGKYMQEAEQFAESVPTLFENKSVDVIAPTKMFSYIITNQQRFNEILDRDFMALIVKTVEEVAPNYLDVFKETLAATTMSYANIIIARDKIFDEYCNYIFSVLFAVEKKIIGEGYWRDIHEKSLSRRFGYIGELLTSSFVLCCERKGLRVLKLPVLENS